MWSPVWPPVHALMYRPEVVCLVWLTSCELQDYIITYQISPGSSQNVPKPPLHSVCPCTEAEETDSAGIQVSRRAVIYSSRWVPTMKAVGYTTPLTPTLPVSAICCVQDLQWVSIRCSFILSPLPPACKSWQANITRRHGAAASHMNNQETLRFELRDRSSMSHSALRQDSEQCNETPPISEEPEASWKKEGCNRGTIS